MIITNINELLTIKPILQELAATPMSAKDGFNVLRTLKAVDKEYEMIVEIQRNMLEKYAMRDADGNVIPDENGSYIIDKEKQQEYIAEASQFLSTEIELDVKPFAWSILENLVITPTQLSMIEKFIEKE